MTSKRPAPPSIGSARSPAVWSRSSPALRRGSWYAVAILSSGLGGWMMLGPGITSKRGSRSLLATARSLGELLCQIRSRSCATLASCDLMLEILAGQQLRNFIPQFVAGVGFAHKTGNFEPFIASDIGIATPETGAPVVMCFMSGGFMGPHAVLDDCIGRMAELVVLDAEKR